MPWLNITGWREGMQKVSATEVLRDHLGLGLAEAKGLVDAILDGCELRLEVDADVAVEELAAALQALGVDAVAEPEA